MSSFADVISQTVQRSPALLHSITGLARRIAPVFVAGRSVFVLGADEVREVFDRTGDFELAAVAHRKQLMGAFLLGMDPRPQYRDERKFLGDVLEGLKGELATISDEVARVAASKLPGLEGGASFDAVGDFAMPVVTRIASRFYGVPEPPDGQPNAALSATGEKLLGGWLRKVGSVIASNSPAPFGLQRVAKQCAEDFGKYLGAVIASRQPDPRASDVLGRLLAVQANQQWSDKRVIANLAGLMLAGSTALVNSFALALKQMCELRRRDSKTPVLGEAIDAVRRGDDDALWATILEAWRFAPTFPVLVRYCARETRIGQGASARVVPAGAQVYVVPQAAMFDASIEDAEHFSAERGEDLYLQFGSGPHTCLGRDAATTELLAMFRAFLSLPGVDGIRVGRIRYDGPAVHALRVTS